MDLYSFADGDPLNHFDPDGRLFAGTLNGAGHWGSQMYAGLGNALDAALHAIVSPWNPLAATRNFSGGYEADFRYQRNFDQGTAAFQLGHQLGYAGAEIGFQMGMFAGPMAFGRMASTAASGGGMSAAIARSGRAMSYGITRAAPSTPIVSLQAPVMTGNTLAGPTKLPATTTASSGGTMNIPQPMAAPRSSGVLYPANALLGPMNHEWAGSLPAAKPATFQDSNDYLRNANGTFAFDGGRKQITITGSTHGNSSASQLPATLYGKFDRNDNFLKWGISQDPNFRYDSTGLNGGYLIPYRTGLRSEMLMRERRLVERFPGPENKEPWAGWRNPRHHNYRGNQ
jgi:hypothetical protein